MGHLFERIILESRWKRKEFSKSSSSSQPRWEGGRGSVCVLSFFSLRFPKFSFSKKFLLVTGRGTARPSLSTGGWNEIQQHLLQKNVQVKILFFFFYLKTVEDETGTAPDDPGIGKNKKKKSRKFKFEKVFFQQRPLVAKTHWVRFHPIQRCDLSSVPILSMLTFFPFPLLLLELGPLPIGGKKAKKQSSTVKRDSF